MLNCFVLNIFFRTFYRFLDILSVSDFFGLWILDLIYDLLLVLYSLWASRGLWVLGVVAGGSFGVWFPGWGSGLGGLGVSVCVWVWAAVWCAVGRGWVRCGGLLVVFAQTSRSPRVRLLVFVCLLGSFKFFSFIVLFY